MITAQKSHTLTWETEGNTGTMEVLEIVSVEVGDTCHEGQVGHQSKSPTTGKPLVCKESSPGEWTWQLRDE